MDNFEDFLKETRFCDFSEEKIKNLVDEIAKGKIKNDREFAVEAFYWVRDNILYGVGDWQRKASETLEIKEGTCTNKANLLVALLRYKKIPAGYGVMKVYGQRYFGPIAIPMLRRFIGKVSTHTYPIIFLDNKWIKCDPDVDKRLSESTYNFNPTSKLVEWNGKENVILNLKKEDIIEDKFPVDDIDPWMLKKSKNAKGIPLKTANIYIDFARNNGRKASNSNELESLFKKYLREKYPFYYYFLKIISFYKKPK